jgi:hypothetical protein
MGRNVLELLYLDESKKYITAENTYFVTYQRFLNLVEQNFFVVITALGPGKNCPICVT